MRIIMLGTGPFAVPTFEALYAARHMVVALVTRPPRPARGRRTPPPNPMQRVAEAHDTPVWMPASVNLPEARDQLAAANPDLLVVCDYGEILTPDTLAVARLGGVNLHASLLPKYRGAAPINWAIYYGESETGVTVIQMTPGLDAGPCIAQRRTPIDPEDTAVDVETRLARQAAELVCESIADLEAGRAEPITQDARSATKAPRLKKTDGLVDWSRTARETNNQVRAMQPWPGTYTFWQRPDGEPLRLILARAQVVDAEGEGPESEGIPPGTVLEAGERLVVATGCGALELTDLQPAGKRALGAAEFLRGYRVEAGQSFGQ